MGKVKTHTFRLGRYVISQEDAPLLGLCDIPDNYSTLRIIIQDGNDYQALSTALHEALHAEGIPDKYLHDEEGYSDTERVARFLWRLGWRKK